MSQQGPTVIGARVVEIRAKPQPNSIRGLPDEPVLLTVDVQAVSPTPMSPEGAVPGATIQVETTRRAIPAGTYVGQDVLLVANLDGSAWKASRVGISAARTASGKPRLVPKVARRTSSAL